MFNYYLHFSDAAKFSDVARNVFLGHGFGSDFAFFGGNLFNNLSLRLFPTSGILPITPFSIAAFFKIFGVNDLAVVATSFFYFFLTLIFVFLLAKKIFNSRFVGILSAVAVGFNYDLINYATNGASELPFIFEIVSTLYFISLRKKWATIVGFILMVAMYFTRTQAFIYIAGLILYYCLTRFKIKKALLFFFSVSVLALCFDRFILPYLHIRFVYSITGIGQMVSGQNVNGTAVSDALRGASNSIGFITLFKKIFYNLYNFYKLMPQIINPYLFTLFLIGIFKLGKEKLLNSFKISSIFIVITTLVVTAAGIPFFRYVHPIIPFVYIIAIGTLVWIVTQVVKNKKSVVIISTLLILFFGVGQTLGIFLLDSRFERNTHNMGRPPVYVLLSRTLKDNTDNNQTIITNLDTWGSWYGERKTVWFPLEPKQIIDPATGKIPFDAIYLTSYLIDDENYYMGADWREIFNNPANPKNWKCDGCIEIAKEFKLKGIYKITSNENYERLDASAILLIRK